MVQTLERTEKAPAKTATVREKPMGTAVAERFAPFEMLDRWFDRWFDMPLLHTFPRPSRWEFPTPAFDAWAPRVDLIDREEAFLVRAELPGVEKKDVDVSLMNDVLTIKGESASEEKEEKGDYYRREICRGTFTRTLALPMPVDENKVKATFKDGLLELTLPKMEQAKRRAVKID